MKKYRQVAAITYDLEKRIEELEKENEGLQNLVDVLLKNKRPAILTCSEEGCDRARPDFCPNHRTFTRIFPSDYND